MCEPEYQYCYEEYAYVILPSKTLAFDVSIAPTGDAYHGKQSSTQRGPGYLYRSRYNGTQRSGEVTGDVTLDGRPLLADGYSYSYANVGSTSSGSLTRIDN